MDPGCRPEPPDAAEDAGSGQSSEVRAVHDLGVQRLVAVPVRLADEDRDSPGSALQCHEASLIRDLARAGRRSTRAASLLSWRPSSRTIPPPERPGCW